MRDPEPGLRELERAATPGPWHVFRESLGYPDDGMIWIEELETPLGSETIPSVKADAALIVALRNAAPALLDLVDAAERMLDRGDKFYRDRGPSHLRAWRAESESVRVALDRLPR